MRSAHPRATPNGVGAAGLVVQCACLLLSGGQSAVVVATVRPNGCGAAAGTAPVSLLVVGGAYNMTSERAAPPRDSAVLQAACRPLDNSLQRGTSALP